MDQMKIGKFIAERRKSVNLTQMQLAEKLNITDRAVSKWETGLAMPDTSIMLELCEILQITADELLNGELASTNTMDIKSNKKTSNVSQNKTMFWVLKSVPVMFGLLAFICSFFTSGAVGEIPEHPFFYYDDGWRPLIYFFFGGGKFIRDIGSELPIDHFSFISLFGVISFVTLVVAILFFIIYVCTKKNKLYVTSCVLFMLSGIFILFLLVKGTTFHGYTFMETFHYLGIGTIIWSLLCILGGAFGFLNHFVLTLKH